MIGIGVTTYNRNKIAANTLAKIKAFAPAEANIVRAGTVGREIENNYPALSLVSLVI